MPVTRRYACGVNADVEDTCDRCPDPDGCIDRAAGMPFIERCARNSDWCDGMLCHNPPHGIGMNPGCPNADPVGLKSTCEKRPGCGCSIECNDYLARVLDAR